MPHAASALSRRHALFIAATTIGAAAATGDGAAPR
jgi:hypothetical protein